MYQSEQVRLAHVALMYCCPFKVLRQPIRVPCGIAATPSTAKAAKITAARVAKPVRHP